MKKLISIALVLLLALTLSSCVDNKTYDESIKVIYFANSNGDVNPDTVLDLKTGDKLTEPTEPVRSGYEFIGWYTDLELENEWNFDTDTVGEKSFTLLAGWVPAVYSITYILNGGEITGEYPVEYRPGEFFITPTARREGFNFVSWYEYEWIDESSTLAGDPGVTSIDADRFGDIILHAHWEVIRIKINFRVEYPGDEADEPDKPSAEFLDYGELIDFPQLEDTDDYRFLGWHSSKQVREDSFWYINGEPITRLSTNIYAYALWEEIE